jgi:hypothetical protein
VLTKKLTNVGFEDVATRERRPLGIDALAPYPVFPPEFLAFLRRVVPADRHQELVHAVVVVAQKPEETGGGHGR